ncbi:MAG TPA: DUF721 domain-containing protein [Desulfopila sp.]|nr:DUF721 domain-containing protein [Desulfopila sp.]
MASAKKKRGGDIAGVLPDIVRHKGWQAKLEQHSFFPVWENVVGEDLAGCSRPLKVVKNVLWLEVANSTWMQQLQFEKRRILEAVNARLSRTTIKDIRFMLAGDERDDEHHKQPGVTFVPPDPEKLRKFEQQVSCIEDEVTRDGLVRLWYLTNSCRRRREP